MTFTLLTIILLLALNPIPAIQTQIAEKSYQMMSNSVACSSEGNPVARSIVVLMKKEEFALDPVKKAARDISSRFAEPDELQVSIETEEQVANWIISPHPSAEHNPKLDGELRREYDRLMALRSPNAILYRHRGNTLLRFTNNPAEEVLETTVLEGSDFTYADGLGFAYEILSYSGFDTVLGQSECVRRNIIVLMAENDFGEATLLKLFRHLSNQYPAPRNLMVTVYTSYRQLGWWQGSPGFKSRVPGFGITPKATDGHYFSAQFSRDVGKSSFGYVKYPFVVNAYGGLEIVRIDLDPIK